jgi:hypothetical protein
MTRQEYKLRVAALKARYAYLFGGRHIGPDFPPGWLPIIEELCANIDAALADTEKPKIHFTQIKEKFGGLRAYLNVSRLRVDILAKDGHRWSGSGHESATPELSTRLSPLVRAAEEKSCTVCIFCGARGSIRGDDWLLALCDKHANSTYRDVEERFEQTTTP